MRATSRVTAALAQARPKRRPIHVRTADHNGGNWPALLWAFTGAALRVGRDDLARRAFEIASRRLHADSWPEYYDGKSGRLIGRRANFNQMWSAAALIASHRLLEDPNWVSLLGIGFPEEQGATPQSETFSR